jgi:putative ABC transport system permease protein
VKLVRSLRISTGSLLRHKLRTALAMSGLVVGVAVVLVMVAVGEGAKREVLAQIERLGTNMLVVMPAEALPTPGRDLQTSRATSLGLGDSEALVAECPTVELTAPARSGTKRVKYGRDSTMATILGTTPAYREIRRAPVERGRYFSEEEATSAQRVAVIGATVVKHLFADSDPLGAQFRIGHVPFRVIGVLKSKGASADGGGDEDNQVLVPVKTALRRLFNIDHLDQVYVQVAAEASLAKAETEIAQLLRTRHDLDRLRRADDFQIEDQARALRTEVSAADSFTTMIAGMAGVSLFVGGIGILSIMLITIRERVGEIGLRMAIGARPRDILVQFMSEALMLGACGGTLGLALGLSVAFGIGEFTEWTTYVSPEWGLAALIASVLLGVVAGVYPAMRAAAMDPIVALRAE